MARLEISIATRNSAGYYRWPFVWIGDEPHPAPGCAPQDEVFRHTLSSGLSVKILREGLFIFDFSGFKEGRFSHPFNFSFCEGAEIQLYRCRVLNTHILCLHSALCKAGKASSTRTMVVDPSNLILFKSLDDREPSVGDLFLQLLLEKRDSDAPSCLSERSETIRLDVIEKSFGLLDRIMERPGDYLLPLTDLYARAAVAYQNHNYSLALVTAWTVTEQLLRMQWKRYLEDNRDRKVEEVYQSFINAERKKRLTEGREYSAAVVAEILSLCDELTPNDYNDLNQVRKARNGWIHDVMPVSMENALLSLDLACRMLMHVERIDLTAALTLSYPH